MEEEKGLEGGLPEEVTASIVDRKAELNAMRKERRKNKEIMNRYASQDVKFLTREKLTIKR